MFKIYLIFLFISLNSYAQFKSDDEVNLVSTGGNTDLKSYNIGSKNQYKVDKSIYFLSAKYTYGESFNVRSVEAWNIDLKFERKLKETLGIYIGQNMESDRFSGISRSYNSDLGLNYTLLHSERKKIDLQAGYRYTIEKAVDESLAKLKDSKGRINVNSEFLISEKNKVELNIEYLPNFTNSEDYLINFEPSLSASLSNIFSLKVGYVWKYDNEPIPGKGKHNYLSLIHI